MRAWTLRIPRTPASRANCTCVRTGALARELLRAVAPGLDAGLTRAMLFPTLSLSISLCAAVRSRARPMALSRSCSNASRSAAVACGRLLLCRVAFLASRVEIAGDRPGPFALASEGVAGALCSDLGNPSVLDGVGLRRRSQLCACLQSIDSLARRSEVAGQTNGLIALLLQCVAQRRRGLRSPPSLPRRVPREPCRDRGRPTRSARARVRVRRRCALQRPRQPVGPRRRWPAPSQPALRLPAKHR